MSAQVALMAGTAALSAASSIASGNAQSNAYLGAAGGARVQGAQADYQAAQVEIQTRQEELKRRVALDRLLAGNRADLAMRGVSADQGSSYDLIQEYNQSQTEKDIANIRSMGESKMKTLSFAKDQANYQAQQYVNMAGMAQTAGWMGALRSIGGAALNYFGTSFEGWSGAGKPSTNGPFAIGGGHDI